MPSDNKKTGKIVAIDWDDHTLRFTEGRITKRDVRIDSASFVRVPIPAEVNVTEPAVFGQFIHASLEKAGITTRRVIVDVPRDKAVLNTLRLPIAVQDELPDMVQIQVARELPFPLSEAVIDFVQGERLDDGIRGEVFVAAVPNDVLEYYRETVLAAGLRLERVGLRPFANCTAATRFMSPTVPERMLFIDVRQSMMEINIIRNGHLAFSRAASVTIPDKLSHTPTLSLSRLENDDDTGGQPSFVTIHSVVNALLIDITRSAEAYRSTDPGMQIEHIVIAGDTGVEEALQEALINRYGDAVHLYNPASTFGWSPEGGAAASGASALIGLLLAHAGSASGYFNFLDPKKTVTVAQQRLRKAPMIAAVITLFVAAGVVGAAQYTAPKRAELARLNGEIDKLRSMDEENSKFVSVIRTIESFDDQQWIWIDLVFDVVSAMPNTQEIVIDQVVLSQKTASINLKTRGKRRETALEAANMLRSYRRDNDPMSPFDQVDVGTQREASGDAYPFSQDIVVTLIDSVKMEKARAEAERKQREEERKKQRADKEEKQVETDGAETVKEPAVGDADSVLGDGSADGDMAKPKPGTKKKTKPAATGDQVEKKPDQPKVEKNSLEEDESGEPPASADKAKDKPGETEPNLKKRSKKRPSIFDEPVTPAKPEGGA